MARVGDNNHKMRSLRHKLTVDVVGFGRGRIKGRTGNAMRDDKFIK
jgi:hypothetical protein